MDSLQSIVDKVLRKRGLEGHAKAAQAVFVAQKILSLLLPHMDEFLKVEKLSQGILVISAKNSIAAQECHGITLDLLAALKAELGEGVVSQVRIVRSS